MWIIFMFLTNYILGILIILFRDSQILFCFSFIFVSFTTLSNPPSLILYFFKATYWWFSSPHYRFLFYFICFPSNPLITLLLSFHFPWFLIFDLLKIWKFNFFLSWSKIHDHDMNRLNNFPCIFWIYLSHEWSPKFLFFRHSE
jgi:hypothetical protein